MRVAVSLAAVAVALATRAGAEAAPASEGAWPIINVLNPPYSAKGDGVSDDTGALRGALAAVAAAGGGGVILPAN
jgi:polygalacturonase